MGKRAYVVMAVLAVALVGVSMWRAWQQREPVYKGRTLTSWLKDIAQYHREKTAVELEAKEAVRQIGTNAVPTLLRWLSARDSALEIRATSLIQRQHLIHVEYTSAAERNRLAMWGFEELRTNARSAVPELIQIANGANSSIARGYAIVSLGFVGAPPEPMVSYVGKWEANVRWGTNSRPSDFMTLYYEWQRVIQLDPEFTANQMANGL